MQIEIDLSTLHKAEGKSSGRPGLVKRKVKVHRGGKVFEQYRWVKSGAEEPEEKKPSAEEPVKKPKRELAIMGLNKPEPEEEGFAHKLKKGDIVNLAGRIVDVKSVDKKNKTVTLGSKDSFIPDETLSFDDVNVKGVHETSEGKFKEEKPEPEKPTKIVKGEMSPGNVESLKSLGDMDIAGGINEGNSHIVNFKDGSNAIYKTTGAISTQGETNVKEIESILGWGNAPETVTGDFGKGEGSCQKWVANTVDMYDEDTEEGSEGVKTEEKHFDDLSKIFLVDLITGNYDRHFNNIKLDKDGKMWAIDNDTWGTRAQYGTVIDNDFSSCVMSKWMDNVDTEEKRDVFQKYVTKNVGDIVKNKDKIVASIKELSKRDKEFTSGFKQQSKEAKEFIDIYNVVSVKSLKDATDNMLANLDSVVSHKEDYNNWYGSTPEKEEL